MDGGRIFTSLAQDRPRFDRHGRHRLVDQQEPGVGRAGEHPVQDGMACRRHGASVVFYVLAMWAMRSEELKFLWGMVRRKNRQGDTGRGDKGTKNEKAGGARNEKTVFSTPLGGLERVLLRRGYAGSFFHGVLERPLRANWQA